MPVGGEYSGGWNRNKVTFDHAYSQLFYYAFKLYIKCARYSVTAFLKFTFSKYLHYQKDITLKSKHCFLTIILLDVLFVIIFVETCSLLSCNNYHPRCEWRQWTARYSSTKVTTPIYLTRVFLLPSLIFTDISAFADFSLLVVHVVGSCHGGSVEFMATSTVVLDQEFL